MNKESIFKQKLILKHPFIPQKDQPLTVGRFKNNNNNKNDKNGDDNNINSTINSNNRKINDTNNNYVHIYIYLSTMRNPCNITNDIYFFLFHAFR